MSISRVMRLEYNAAAFLTGVLVAFLPPLLYFGYYGEIQSMLYCTFVFGFVYGTEGFALGTGIWFLATLLFPIHVFLGTGVKNKRLWLLVIANTVGMCMTLGMGNSTLHDYMLILPGVMMGVWRMVEGLKQRKKDAKRLVWAGLVFAICFAYPGYKTMGACREMIRQAGDSSTYEHVIETAACIPAAERDSVWGYEVPLRWYSIADIMPCSKYCGWQEHYMELSPQIEADITQMMNQEPPEWIVTKARAVIRNEMMKAVLLKSYEIYAENEDFVLYRKVRI